jgi:small subunit ribosomal protein S16
MPKCPLYAEAASHRFADGQTHWPKADQTVCAQAHSNHLGETTKVATKIRLKRLGKIRTPHYRVVVMDSRTKRDGRPIEEIGQYHPKSDPSEIIIDSERAQYWLGVGAQPTEAVVALMKRTGDWQKFTGDDSIPAGVVPQPTKPNKLDVFNAALAEANDEPAGNAVTRSKRSKKVEEAAPAEAETPVEEAPAPAEAETGEEQAADQATTEE